jgi:hypothetical protein
LVVWDEHWNKFIYKAPAYYPRCVATGNVSAAECSASSDNENLFIEKTLARLAAKQCPPFEDVSEIEEDEEEYVYDLSEYNPNDIQF